MNYNKIRNTCKYIRITVGLALIILGFITNNTWLYLGIIPFVAGIINFCPLCIITKKCTT